MGLNLLKKYYTKKIRINAAAEALAISLPLSPTVYPLNSRKYFSWVRWLSGTVSCDTRHAGQMYQGAGAGAGTGKGSTNGRREKHLKHLMGCLENVINCQCVGVSTMNTCIRERLCVCVCVRLLSSTSHFRVQFQEKILRNADEIFIIPKRSSLG